MVFIKISANYKHAIGFSYALSVRYAEIIVGIWREIGEHVRSVNYYTYNVTSNIFQLSKILDESTEKHFHGLKKL